jgi:DTW domain-containing protein YfiP
MMAPDTTSIHEFPDHPAFDPAETVLLFPSDDATPISELDISKVKRVVFIDSQWNRVNRILPDEKLARLPKVKITSYKTHFWRYQQEGADCLSTIEAIYHFYREFHMRAHGKYDGEYDNLLWYFSFFHGLIQNHYKANQKEFPRIKGFLGDPNSHSAPESSTSSSDATTDKTAPMTSANEENPKSSTTAPTTDL